MFILFFDVETNGWQRGPMSTRVIQLAWQRVDFNTAVPISEKSYLIKPDRWTIPETSQWHKDHGFSVKKNYREGYPMAQVLDEFLEDYVLSDYLAAHNIVFDLRTLGAEMVHYKRAAAKKIPRICTMEPTKELCGLKDKKGHAKHAKLEELYKFLFNRAPEGMHDAGNDVKICRENFFELVARQVIEVPQLAENGKAEQRQ